MFGSIPVALGNTEIARHVLLKAKNVEELVSLTKEFSEMSLSDKDKHRAGQAAVLAAHWDARHFVKKIEEVAR
jgi:hypothetical protein